MGSYTTILYEKVVYLSLWMWLLKASCPCFIIELSSQCLKSSYRLSFLYGISIIIYLSYMTHAVSTELDRYHYLVVFKAMCFQWYSVQVSIMLTIHRSISVVRSVVHASESILLSAFFSFLQMVLLNTTGHTGS